LDECPEAGQAVAQLEGVADELLRRRGRHAEDPAELGDTELRHQRRAVPGDGLLVLTPRHSERGGGVDRLRRVEIRPPGRGDEEVGGRAVLRGLAGSGIGQHVEGGEVIDLACL
jgi:hypothetical protein